MLEHFEEGRQYIRRYPRVRRFITIIVGLLSMTALIAYAFILFKMGIGGPHVDPILWGNLTNVAPLFINYILPIGLVGLLIKFLELFYIFGKSKTFFKIIATTLVAIGIFVAITLPLAAYFTNWSVPINLGITGLLFLLLVTDTFFGLTPLRCRAATSNQTPLLADANLFRS